MVSRFIHFFIVGVLSVLFTSCVKSLDEYTPHKEDANTFDFNTTADVDITLSYKNTGYEVKVYFELYDENPLEYSQNGASATLKEGVTPFFCGYTDSKGNFSKILTIPSYEKKVYVYSPSFFARTLLEADVIAGKVNVDDNQTTSVQSFSRSLSRAVGTNTAIDQDKWNVKLGNWDPNGYIYYQLSSNDPMTLSSQKAIELLLSHQDSISIGKDCPVSLRTKKDLTLTKDANVVITFLGGNTCWSSSLGYYYYSGNAPTSYDQIKNKVIMIFPNTQDGHWDKNDHGMGTKGVERGTAVQLFYYGDDLKGTESPYFPEGTHIGFVLRSHTCKDNALSCELGNSSHVMVASTTPGCNVGNVKYTVASGCSSYTIDGKNLLISFEDHDDDENFSDVVIAMSTFPDEAISDVISLNKSENTTTSPSSGGGVYAFEDMWPSEGDYDMNDVMVNYSSSRIIPSRNDAAYAVGENFEFTVYQNYASLNNGLAFTIDNPPANATYTMYIDGKETAFAEDRYKNTFYLTNNVKNIIGKKIVVRANYPEADRVDQNNVSTVHPFIYRKESDGKYLEIHTPKDNPTDRANMSYFGTEDDLSANGTYYVRAGNYPFAFFLAGATTKDIAPMLDPNNEKKSIDTLYSGYAEWATSNGVSNSGWYK